MGLLGSGTLLILLMMGGLQDGNTKLSIGRFVFFTEYLLLSYLAANRQSNHPNNLFRRWSRARSSHTIGGGAWLPRKGLASNVLESLTCSYLQERLALQFPMASFIASTLLSTHS